LKIPQPNQVAVAVVALEQAMAQLHQLVQAHQEIMAVFLMVHLVVAVLMQILVMVEMVVEDLIHIVGSQETLGVVETVVVGEQVVLMGQQEFQDQFGNQALQVAQAGTLQSVHQM
jgi:hypothetical protein